MRGVGANFSELLGQAGQNPAQALELLQVSGPATRVGPDIIGGTLCIEADGTLTETISFTDEQSARKGEQMEMPDGTYKDAARKHYAFGHWCFTTTKLVNFEEARVKLDVARSQLIQAQDKVYEERIERDRATRYGSAYYGN